MPPLQAGFETPPAVCYTSVIMEKCVSPADVGVFARNGNVIQGTDLVYSPTKSGISAYFQNIFKSFPHSVGVLCL